MGDSRSWAAAMESEITVCKHGAKSKYFDNCMCDGCISDRAISDYRKGMKDKIKNHFSKYLETLSNDDLEKMAEKIR